MTDLTFDEFTDVVRERLGIADAVDLERLHRFREDLMSDEEKAVIPQGWYHNVFDELEVQGHLDGASSKMNGYDACGRLSAEGRYYLAHPLDEE